MTRDAGFNILYFAGLGERLGRQQEIYTEQPLPLTVAELLLRLAARSGLWQQALTAPNIRCAVNQQVATSEHTLRPGDEVAFFPPVTGG